MRVSFAGFSVCDVKVREGSDRAAAQTLEFDVVLVVEAVGDDVGDDGGSAVAATCLGACLCSCKAFASAFSCVRTKYARFWRSQPCVWTADTHECVQL